MSFSLFVMLALILLALWRIGDPQGRARFDEALSWIGGMVLFALIMAVPLALLIYVGVRGAPHH
jgi:hypothetical protein